MRGQELAEYKRDFMSARPPVRLVWERNVDPEEDVFEAWQTFNRSRSVDVLEECTLVCKACGESIDSFSRPDVPQCKHGSVAYEEQC